MAVDSITGNSATPAPSSTATPTTQQPGLDPLASEDTFLKLFVAQLQNQDPMNPQDGTQFVAQLAQFSTLEQTMQMSTDLSSIRTDLENYLSSATTGTSSTTSTQG